MNSCSVFPKEIQLQSDSESSPVAPCIAGITPQTINWHLSHKVSMACIINDTYLGGDGQNFPLINNDKLYYLNQLS